MSICIYEKNFINYLKKWYLGERIKFIKKDIKFNNELKKTNIITESGTYNIKIYDNINDWIQNIENRALFMYTKNLDYTKKYIIYKVLIENYPLVEIAQDLHISKQLAYAYKKQYINNAKKILKIN